MKAPFETVVRDISVSSPVRAKLSFRHSGGDNQGLLLDNVKLFKMADFHTSFTKPTPPILVKDERYYVRESDTALEKKEWKRAKQIIEEGLRKFPSNADLWHNRSLYYFRCKDEPKQIRPIEVQRSMQRAYKLRPSGKYAAEMGWLYRSLHGDCETALSYFEEAERKGYVKEKKTLLYIMGECYEKRGYIATAREYYRRFIDIAPENEKAPDARDRLLRLR
jgi:tetratricopeptide (TPR) repeat protein